MVNGFKNLMSIKGIYKMVLVSTFKEFVQARSQKFAMGGGLVWGVSGQGLQRSKILHFLQKYLNFRAILMKNNAFKIVA